MAQTNVSLETINRFFAQKRIALVGVSRNPRDIGAQLVKEFRRHGYDVVIVNPHAPSLLGEPCYVRLQDIQPPPQAALLITSPSVTDVVVRDCHEAGIQHVWMFRGGGQGSVSASAVEFCREHHMEVVPGQCPFMFLDPVRHVHWLHRCIVKITGHYPRRTTALAL